ncbi:MAG TPA: glycoside hydrolase family 99-like domain-containing protein [Lacipirellulaceae bacterium]|nr:glycoside hydrolase family 99-like domain-containing protein [Lacipirellulaceae bacterium]
MPLSGHVDFYGYHDAACGWFFCGWSEAWSWNTRPNTVVARFLNGELVGDYLSVVYRREDVGDRGLGFIVFIAGEPTLRDFERLTLVGEHYAGDIIPTPLPERLYAEDLARVLLPLLRDHGSGVDLGQMLGLQFRGPSELRHNGQYVENSRGLPRDARVVHHALFSSSFVDSVLCRQNIGCEKNDINAAIKYLELPVKARPKISYYFDPAYYLDAYSDLTTSNVDFDPLIHYSVAGVGEGRSPHPLINIDYMRSIDKYLLSATPGLQEICDALEHNLVDPSPYFSVADYIEQAPEARSHDRGCLHHYLSTGYLRGLRPNGLFDPVWYYRHLEEGVHDYWSGLRHFVLHGDGEARSPSADFDAARYLKDHRDVSEAGVPPLRHYLTAGKAERRRYRPAIARSNGSTGADDEPRMGSSDRGKETALASYEVTRRSLTELKEAQKQDVSVAVCELEECPDPTRLADEISFPSSKRTPIVSIIIPVYNEARYTGECLKAIANLRNKTRYEVIVADDCSSDPDVGSFAKIKNLIFIRNPENLGFLRNCNAALSACRGRYLLLLNNDAQLMPGALDAMVRVLDENPDVAAVGPKILYPNGRLQEAGCTLDREGNSTMVGLFADPNDAAFNYDRDVQYCSGAALLVRRSAIGEVIFDEAFAPAYCEDADLCLRLSSEGWRIVYCHTAEVAHHLSVSMNRESVMRRMQTVTRNQDKLTKKWSEYLEQINKVRVIAFYLPQYHPTPENDYYWGLGFTEWTNVSKARPAYRGHYQPHLPTDLGFYDLRIKETFGHQASLARRYGVSGFCVYYYNFGDRRALDQAFEAAIADEAVDFPYCVCWANENWTRHWDGGNREIIFEQKYDPSTLRAIVNDTTRYASDPRYIRVNGKPLFLVYRPTLIPDPGEFAKLCRDAFCDAGFGGVHLVYVESMETAQRGLPPSKIGFDASVEFPPQGRAVPYQEQPEIFEPGFDGHIYDYPETVLALLAQRGPGYRRYPAVFPSWDNTPRQPLRGDSFFGANPGIFQVYVEEKLEQACRFFVGEERLLFVNAWNEWAEGTHLEPDRKFGHQWLDAIRNALLAKSLI